MPIFTSTDLERFANQGENDFSVDRPFLMDRYSLTIVGGIANYVLPDYVNSIRRVSFLGQKLDPMTQRNQREVFQAANQTGTPFWYVFNNIAANTIRLFPTPEQSIAPGTLLWSSDIPTCCVVEFFRSSDNSTFVLPPWKKRQMLKSYIKYRSYGIDGPGYNVALRKYYKQRWEFSETQFSELLDYLYNAPRKLVISEIVSSNYFPGEPVLPIDQFGISVDEGY